MEENKKKSIFDLYSRPHLMISDTKDRRFALLEEAQRRAKLMQESKPFYLHDLFNDIWWSNLVNSDRISLSKRFKNTHESSGLEVVGITKFGTKYRRIELNLNNGSL